MIIQQPLVTDIDEKAVVAKKISTQQRLSDAGNDEIPHVSTSMQLQMN